MFSWIKRLFANSRPAPDHRCPRCQAEMDRGEIICPQCGHGYDSGQDPFVEFQLLVQGEPTPTLLGGAPATGGSTDKQEDTRRVASAWAATDILFLHPGFHKGFVVRFEGVVNLFHAFTLFQHAFLNRAELPFADAGQPATFEEATARRKLLKDWPGPEPCPSAEVTSIPASHLGECVHGNTWDYCPWFTLKPEGLLQDLFIGGNHALNEIPQFEGQRIILLGRARGLRTWLIDLPDDDVAHVRVLRTLGIEEVDDWCGRLIKANAGLKLEGRAGCAVCTHRFAMLERGADPTAPADGG